MKREGAILVVDPDGVSRRLIELKLGGRGWQVESAKDAHSALEILHNTRVVAILSEQALPDMPGLQLHRRLMQENRLRNVPFVVVTSDERLESQVAFFKAGVEEYLTKPYEPRILTVRVEALIARAMRARIAMANRTYLLAGDFAALPLPDLVATLSLQRRSGIIFVAAEGALGEVHLATGEVVHAVFGTLTGEPAVQGLFRESSAHFEFSPHDAPLPLKARTISSPTTALFMNAAKAQDDAARHSAAQGEVSEPMSEAGVPVPRTADALTQSRQVVAGIQSEFSLGELMFFVGRELDSWVRREHEGSRVHVHFVTDLSVGVSALLGMSTPATERQLLGGLSPGSKCIGVSFFLRGGQLLDLILIDINSPALLVSALSRSPTLTIIAPPGGDALVVGPRSLVGLNALLQARPPELLVGLGGANMETMLKRIGAGRRTLFIKGTLEEGRDLRKVLVEAVTVWGTP